MGGKPIPNPSYLDECVPIGAVNGKKRWRSADSKRLYTWDSLHGEIEVYNNRGRHLGVLSPDGVFIKEAVKGRKLMSNFITDCINGDALMSDINDYIDMWHDGDSDNSLHDYLGMTKKEYVLFVQDESYLGSIISAHKYNKSVVSIVRDQIAIAARSDDAATARNLQTWLENEGLWD